MQVTLKLRSKEVRGWASYEDFKRHQDFMEQRERELSEWIAKGWIYITHNGKRQET